MAEPAACRNCSAALQGAYCHDCGQPAHDKRTPIWTAVTIFVEETFGADGRFWITLRKLLFFPGRLTVEFLEGKQRRSLHPLRLFLIASVMALLTPDLLDAPRFEWPQAWDAPAPEGSSCSERFSIANERLVAWNESDDVTLEQRRAFAVELSRNYLVWCLLGSVFLTVLAVKALRPRRLLYDHIIFLLHLASFAYLFDAALRTVGLHVVFDGGLQTAIQTLYTMVAFRVVYPSRAWPAAVAWPFDLACGAAIFYVIDLANLQLQKISAAHMVMPPAAVG